MARQEPTQQREGESVFIKRTTSKFFRAQPGEPHTALDFAACILSLGADVVSITWPSDIESGETEVYSLPTDKEVDAMGKAG